MNETHGAIETDTDTALMNEMMAGYLRTPAPRAIALPLPVMVDQLKNWLVQADTNAWTCFKGNYETQRNEMRCSLAAAGESVRCICESRCRSALELLDKCVGNIPKDAGHLDDVPDARAAARVLEGLSQTLLSDDAIRAAWEDLATDAREKRPVDGSVTNHIAILRSIEHRRGVDPDKSCRELATYLESGREPYEPQADAAPVDTRIDTALEKALEPPERGHVVWWIGLGDIVIFDSTELGPVTLLDATWHMGNLGPDRPDFPHKAELASIDESGKGLFEPIGRDDPWQGTTVLARVDLGDSSLTGSYRKALELLGATLLSEIAGTDLGLPRTTSAASIVDGQVAEVRYLSNKPPTWDTERWIGSHMARRFNESLRATIPALMGQERSWCLYLSALRKFERASLPLHDVWLPQNTYFPRSMWESSIDLFTQSLADLASWSGINDLRERLVKLLAKRDYDSDVRDGVRCCLHNDFGVGDADLRRRLDAGIRTTRGKPRAWLEYANEHKGELESLCPSWERGRVGRCLSSITDAGLMRCFDDRHAEERQLQNDRLRFARNCIQHSHHCEDEIEESVLPFAEEVCGLGLSIARQSAYHGTTFDAELASWEQDEDEIRNAGGLLAYWESRVRS